VKKQSNGAWFLNGQSKESVKV